MRWLFNGKNKEPNPAACRQPIGSTDLHLARPSHATLAVVPGSAGGYLLEQLERRDDLRRVFG
jgi:hypothetical protein